jgi:FKBP-type peptidyl-prolyl cis-trans isomerase (trigger factor)
MRSLIVIPGLMLLAGGLVLAGGSNPVKEVRVSVVAILASESKEQVDPRLESIAKEIKKIHPTMKGFRMGKMSCKPIPSNKGVETFELVADQTATVTVMKAADKENKVQLKVTPPTIGEITYTTTCGKFFPIVTHYETPSKERLIIAVRVQPSEAGK